MCSTTTTAAAAAAALINGHNLVRRHKLANRSAVSKTRYQRDVDRQAAPPTAIPFNVFEPREPIITRMNHVTSR